MVLGPQASSPAGYQLETSGELGSLTRFHKSRDGHPAGEDACGPSTIGARLPHPTTKGDH